MFETWTIIKSISIWVQANLRMMQSFFALIHILISETAKSVASNVSKPIHSQPKLQTKMIQTWTQQFARKLDPPNFDSLLPKTSPSPTKHPKSQHMLPTAESPKTQNYNVRMMSTLSSYRFYTTNNKSMFPVNCLAATHLTCGHVSNASLVRPQPEPCPS